jgi:outer membrane protein W
MGIFILFVLALSVCAQDEKNFVAGLGGFAILSGDAQTEFARGAVASSYAPKNGAAFNVAAGRHFNDWLGIQGNYIWNRNEVTLNGVAGGSFYSAVNRSRQHQVVLDGLLYFRPLGSRIRPYLSTGVAGVRMSREQIALTSSGAPALPAAQRAVWWPGIRVAVGIDLLLPNRFGFRYSFSETLTSNLFSESLVPPGRKKLMNFQNLFGVVKYF